MAFKSAKQRRAFFYKIGIKNKVIHAPKGFDIHSADISPDKTEVNVEMRTTHKKYIKGEYREKGKEDLSQ